MKVEYYERGREIVQNAPQLFIDLDVEADGKAGYGSLLSVGAVSPTGEEFYRELKPTSDLYIPAQRNFCEEHNLQRERLLEEGTHPAVAMRELAKWTNDLKAKYQKKGHAVLSAFNASFDYAWIDLEMLKAGVENPYGIAGYCIKSMAQAIAVKKGYDWSTTAKSKLPPEILPDGDFTHHALEDARYQQALHFAQIGLIDDLSGLKHWPEMEQHEEEGQKVLGWHRDFGGGSESLFVCGRCSDGRDCMETEVFYLTKEQAATFKPKITPNTSIEMW